jgi:hypothetical protein
MRKTTDTLPWVVVWDPDGEYTGAEAEAGQEGYDQLSSVHDVKPHRPTEMSTFKRSIKRDLRCQLSS